MRLEFEVDEIDLFPQVVRKIGEINEDGDSWEVQRKSQEVAEKELHDSWSEELGKDAESRGMDDEKAHFYNLYSEKHSELWTYAGIEKVAEGESEYRFKVQLGSYNDQIGKIPEEWEDFTEWLLEGFSEWDDGMESRHNYLHSEDERLYEFIINPPPAF